MVEGPQEEQTPPGKCPSCGGAIIQDYQRSEEVCSDCGLVVREQLKDRGPEWHSYDDEDGDRSRGGPPVSEELHDRGLGTNLAPPTKDGKGKGLPPGRRADLGRQRKWQYRFSVEGDRGLKKGLSRAKTVRSQLGIPRGISRRACRLYRLASNEGLVKGRSRDAFVAAAFDEACREASVPRDLEDFAGCLGADLGKVENAKKVLESEFSLAPPFPSLSKWVNELLDSLWIPKASIKERAREIVEKIEKSRPPRLNGRSISGLAGGIVYLAFVEGGRPESEGVIADATDRSRTTIQKNSRLIKEAVL